MGSLAKYLLIDPDTGKFRPDDEAILANFVIADGDTRGPNRFMETQAELVPTFAGKAEYLPDIGHFIKCISNSFYKLATKHTELRGKNLLEAPRIRCICSDISQYLRDFGVELRKGIQGEELEKQRKRCLRRIDAVIHHHCGDHERCEPADCLYRRIENHHVCKYRAEKQDKQKEPKSRSQILAFNEQKIDEDYAANSRFSGISMSMGKKGRAKLKQEITKRLDEKNIDRVARCMSSNRCENYFSVLVKYTCGKRIYFGRKKVGEFGFSFPQRPFPTVD